MYKLKKIFALFLAIVLATSFSTVAFAAEDESGIPENATKHTIEVTVEPGETFDGSEDGIAPYIWNQIGHTVSGDKTYTLQFTVPDRYFAYEYSAVPTSGGTSSGSYSVSLLLSAILSPLATGSGIADGANHKVDWIDLSGNSGSYQFLIINSTGTSITVSITYYSWA